MLSTFQLLFLIDLLVDSVDALMMNCLSLSLVLFPTRASAMLANLGIAFSLSVFYQCLLWRQDSGVWIQYGLYGTSSTRIDTVTDPILTPPGCEVSSFPKACLEGSRLMEEVMYHMVHLDQ
jgi:hypothetical protein